MRVNKRFFGWTIYVQTLCGGIKKRYSCKPMFFYMQSDYSMKIWEPPVSLQTRFPRRLPHEQRQCLGSGATQRTSSFLWAGLRQQRCSPVCYQTLIHHLLWRVMAVHSHRRRGGRVGAGRGRQKSPDTAGFTWSRRPCRFLFIIKWEINCKLI